MDEASFARPEEVELARPLLERGWVKRACESPDDLARIRREVCALAAEQIGMPVPGADQDGADQDGADQNGADQGVGDFLDGIAEHLTLEDLNTVRLSVFRNLNSRDWLRPAVFRLARRALHALVGNELAMQRRVNLSIQMPGDQSSLLPLHADSWSGDSPYEIVLWIPLVDCSATKSFFILPRPAQERLLTPEAVRSASSVEGLYGHVADDVHFLDLRYGEILLFDQNLLHGNRVNEEPTTRWSLNCRFKGLFTPYADKKLGEFFEPITVRPMSRLGMSHRFPTGFAPDPSVTESDVKSPALENPDMTDSDSKKSL